MYSLWTLQRLIDYLAEETCQRMSIETRWQLLRRNGIASSCPQHKIISPDPIYLVKKDD